MSGPARSGRAGPILGDLDGILEFIRANLDRTVQSFGEWFQNNVAASQTDVLLNRADYSAASVGFSATKLVADEKGTVKLLWVKSNAARTVGSLTVTLYVNGTSTALTAVLDGSNTTFKRTEVAEGTVRFYPGDELELKITTSGDWAPTTADIVAGCRLILNS